MSSIHFAGKFSNIPVGSKESRPGVIGISALEAKVREAAKKNGVEASIDYLEKKDTLNIGTNGEDKAKFTDTPEGGTRYVNVTFSEKVDKKTQMPERTKTDNADWDFAINMVSDADEQYHYGHWSPTETNNHHNFSIPQYSLLEGNFKWAKKTLD